MLPISQQALEAMAREAAQVALQRVADQRKSQRFVLYGNNLAVLTDQSKEILLCGPTRTGKSFAWLVKLHQFATKYPRFRGLIVRKTRASLSESALQTFEQQVLGPSHPLVINGPRRRYRESYIYPNGAEIVIDGMDKKTKILSTEFDIIFFQEATEATIDDIEYLITRLSNDAVGFHQLLLDCNPDHPKHPLKLRVESGRTKYYESRHEDNPKFYNQATQEWTKLGLDYVFGTLSQLSGVRYKRFRLGIWAAAEGAIYEEFREEVHVISRSVFPGGQIPHHWEKIRVIDFGYKAPFVCQWWARDPGNNEIVMYREIYITGQLVEDLAPQIKHLSGEYDHPAVIAWMKDNGITERNERERIVVTICDHDAEDRATLSKYGIFNIAAFKRIKLGIQAVQSRLKVDQNTGRAKLMLVEDALVAADPMLIESKLPTCTLDEIGGYEWEKTKDGKPIQEVPRMIDDHGMDTMRYAICWFDEIGSELESQETTYVLENEEYYTISEY